MRLNREKICAIIDAIIALEEKFWEYSEPAGDGYTYAKTLEKRKLRGEYLEDDDLEKCYQMYIKLYESLPKTLCHDDLLPFNTIVNSDRAVLIDWEVAGVLPYPTPLARLLAHTEDLDGALFYAERDTCEFAVRYYYDNLVKKKGIAYRDYVNAMRLFLFYEYSEWIMLGNKYGDRESHYYKRSLALAKKLVPDILSGGGADKLFD